MNKAELIDAIASSSGLTKADSERALNATLATIEKAVSNGDKVILVGFGTFEQRQRQARQGRNPRTGQLIEVPATKVPAFSAGKAFKERLAGK